MKDIVNRFRRVRGQIESIEARLEEGENCTDIIPQLLAIKGSVDSALQAYFETSLNQCATKPDTDEMRSIIKTLLKNM